MEENKIESTKDESTLTAMVAKDFCFYLEQDDTDGDTYAYFCPIKFFHESGSMSKEIYDVLDEVVPDDMDEVQDNCYATSRKEAEVEAELLKIGFVKDEAFCEFMLDIGEEEETSEDDTSTALTGT